MRWACCKTYTTNTVFLSVGEVCQFGKFVPMITLVKTDVIIWLLQ